MANYCVFCGEEIPEYRVICKQCNVVLDSLPPDRAKKLQKVLKNEEARAKLRAAIREVKLQMRIALEPIVALIVDFIDSVFAVITGADDGNKQ